MRGGVALLAGILATAAAAQTLPALYDVEGVAADDVLNLRDMGAAESEIVGALPPDARRVEVIRRGDDWALVNSGERAAWASLRYLALREQADWFSGDVPLRCLGTEPFWHLDYDPKSRALHVTPMDGAPEVWPVNWLDQTRFGSASVLGLSLNDGFATLRGEICSDGMSERLYGIAFDAFLEGGSRRLSGCCSLNR